MQEVSWKLKQLLKILETWIGKEKVKGGNEPTITKDLISPWQTNYRNCITATSSKKLRWSWNRRCAVFLRVLFRQGCESAAVMCLDFQQKAEWTLLSVLARTAVRSASRAVTRLEQLQCFKLSDVPCMAQDKGDIYLFFLFALKRLYNENDFSCASVVYFLNAFSQLFCLYWISLTN